MDQQDRLDTIEQGKRATVVKGVVDEYVSYQVGKITSRLVAAYRGGSLTHDQILGGIAEISALFTLVNDLASEQRAGESAMKQEIEHGQKANGR